MTVDRFTSGGKEVLPWRPRTRPDAGLSPACRGLNWT
jgi:hypothetical protein